MVAYWTGASDMPNDGGKQLFGNGYGCGFAGKISFAQESLTELNSLHHDR